MDAARYRQLRFTPLAEEDLPQIYAWLQEPHIRDFYYRKSLPGWEEVRAEYFKRIDPAWPTRCFLIRVDRAMGYIQTYRIADYPDYAVQIGESRGIGVDLFIGDVSQLGIGWGRLVLSKFLAEVAFPLFPQEEVCWIHHEPRNQRALRASKAAGFRYVRDFVEEELQQLLVYRRPSTAGLAEQK